MQKIVLRQEEHMDLIGHLAVIEEAGLLRGDELWGKDALAAMFPNIAHCHQWAYESLWNAHQYTDAPIARTIQAHMICDWVIHYGAYWTPVRERIGWAYKEMPKAVDQLDRFMDHVVKKGYARQDPRSLDERSHLERDFGHTAVECALDIRLAQKYTSQARLEAVCNQFTELGSQKNPDEFIRQVFAETGGHTLEPEAVLLRTVEDYARWSRIVKRSYEFAAFTILSKFNIEETPESLQFVVEFLDALSRSFAEGDMRQMVDQIVERIANPELAILRGHGGPASDAGRMEDHE